MWNFDRSKPRGIEARHSPGHPRSDGAAHAVTASAPLHGYGIARRIEQVSGDRVILNQGTIYTSLVRLEQRGWIKSKWGVSENNRRAKFYSITRVGEKQLVVETENWERLAAVMGRVLASGEQQPMKPSLRIIWSRLWARVEERTPGPRVRRRADHPSRAADRRGPPQRPVAGRRAASGAPASGAAGSAPRDAPGTARPAHARRARAGSPLRRAHAAEERRDSPPSSPCRSRSASAPTRRCSAWSTICCFVRCRLASPIAWCRSGRRSGHSD